MLASRRTTAPTGKFTSRPRFLTIERPGA
jgi:hypothetical protein